MVGESGSGKSVTALSLLRLLPPYSSRIEGRILLEGQDLVALDDREITRIRGSQIGMIFQEPMTALDPVFTVGQQIVETLRTHQRVSRRVARARAVEILGDVEIPEPRRRLD